MSYTEVTDLRQIFPKQVHCS